jgi:serine protease DegS
MALGRENDAVIITDVLPKSPAEKAGLRAGDVLLQIAGQPVTELQATVEIVRRETPGSEIAVHVRRQGADKEIKVKVAMFPFSLLGLLG